MRREPGKLFSGVHLAARLPRNDASATFLTDDDRWQGPSS